ncbi:hypothetical protein [Pseudochryseolinea flava]|uniref:Uncharacterized protein n=1 Tax=Pseudochryseolinea flava TaxID=2059302 RepID=A0A364Y7T8_9BACT|nr:hypothetical protein [Pseudochryseolinea flava]RAW03176.1 hypothetical protein DQQ10_03535 [Pseudochryseolinea flava]
MIKYFKGAMLLATVFCTIISCSSPKEKRQPLPFDPSHSDPAAVELVDSVVSAAGGVKAWDDARYFSWTSAAERKIFWDKHNSKVRIESANELYLIDLNDSIVQIKGKEKTTLEDVSNAFAVFNECAQELALPFLLKQFGSTLVYLGEDSLSDGTRVNVLNHKPASDTSLTLTVHIGVKDNLIKQVVKNRKGETTTNSGFWDNYKEYNNLLLSVDRTSGSGPKNLSTEAIDENKFVNF